MFSATQGCIENISESGIDTTQLVLVLQQPRSISRHETDEALEILSTDYRILLLQYKPNCNKTWPAIAP